MSKLWMAVGLSLIGHIWAWFHMQAQFRWEWAKSLSWVILGGIPISFLFFYSTRMFYEYYGDYWSVRPIGFGMATLVFSILTYFILHETPDFRTWITMILSVIIIIIQLSHVTIK